MPLGLDTTKIFYVLVMDEAVSVHASAKDAIKTLRNVLKANVKLQPTMIKLQTVDIEALYKPARGAITSSEVEMAHIVRGLMWADTDYPDVWP